MGSGKVFASIIVPLFGRFLVFSKRIAASLVATGMIVSGGVVAPQAQAASVSVEGEVCTVTYNSEEAKMVAGTRSEKLTKKEFAEAYKELAAEIADAEADLEREYDEFVKAYDKTTPGYSEAIKEFEDARKEIERPTSLVLAYKACADGRNVSETSSKIDSTLSSYDGSLSPAGIGVVSAGAVVVVLGALAAALPMLKPMLPANIAALLP